MGVATVTTLVDNTTIDVDDLNSNFSNLKNSVNNVTTDQITNGTIVNADISSTAGIEMSKITGTASDATLDAVMENFISGCYVYRVDGDNIGITVGSAMIDGELRRITSAKTNLSVPAMSDGHWVDVWLLADAAASVPTYAAIDTDSTTPGGSASGGTNDRLIGSLLYLNSTNKITKTINYRDGEIIGWDYLEGDGTSNISGTVKFGKTLHSSEASTVFATLHGRKSGGAAPTGLNDMITDISTGVQYRYQCPRITTTQFEIVMDTASSNFAANEYYGFSWRVVGQFT